MLHRFMDSGPPFPLSLLILAIVIVPVTLLHELGHAAAARWLLGRHARMRLRLTLFGGAIDLDDSHAKPTDVLIIALAGPLVSLVGVLFAARGLSLVAADGLPHDLLWAATLGSAFGVLNLIPVGRTDGRLALNALR